MIKKAFSLIELSIVLIIIAVIIAGVTQSSSLLAKAKLQSAQSATLNSPVAGIPDLIMWFETTLDKSFATTDGSVQTEDGTQITAWNDINPQSSTGVHATFVMWSEGISYRKNGINGLPSLYSDNSNISFGDNGFPKINAPSQTIFAVYMMTSEVFPSMSLGCCDVYNALSASSGDRGLQVYNGYVAATDSFPINSTEIASMTSDSSYANLYINGKNEVPNEVITVPSSAGSFLINFENGQGYLSELILFDRALKDEERQEVEQYLGKKYGVNVVKENRPTI
jgi:prepilin-type N-terminal cleavage/methylation domain-containing protein